MALFKILKGESPNLPESSQEGWMYITEDTGDIHLFTNTTTRLHLNADKANAIRSADNTKTYNYDDITTISSNIETTNSNLNTLSENVYNKTETNNLLNNKAPFIHASRHATGGADPITPGMIGAATTATATTSAAGLMSAADKSKLDGIAAGANNYTYTLPTATSSVLGGVKTGSNITNSSGVISLTKANVTSALGYTPPTSDTTYSAATQSAAGLMSAADKKKLDGIATGANNYTYTLPAATSSVLGGVKVGSNITNSSGTISLTKANVTSALGYTPPTSDTNTHYITRIYTGASGTAANAAATSPYIKITDDNTYRNQIRLVGSGATTVTSDANGNITISSTDTNTNTTYSAGTGISLSGTTFSNSGVRSIATGSSNGTISVNTNGTTVNVAVKGLGSNAYTSTAYLPTSGGTINGALTVTGGAKISGRYAGGGDDEGLVIGRADNNYAGLTLGEPAGVRSVFYLLPDNSAVWRHNTGSSGFDIKHPDKAGTIALTSDIPTSASAIGAAPSSHSQAASTITAGTFAGQVVANSGGQTYSTSLLRNSKLVSSTTNPSVNGEIYWTYG